MSRPHVKRGLLASAGAVAAAALASVITVRTVRRLLNPRARYDAAERRPYGAFEKRVLVVGGGFGGYAAVRNLSSCLGRREDVGVMLVSAENYLTFWPMVPGIISGEVSAEDVAQPLRRALITAGASFRRASLESIDFGRRIAVADGRPFPYDHLVLALGSEPAFFGIPGVEEHGMTMKSISDAEKNRDRVIERFEQATLADGAVPDSRLTFVVIGGGPTGVETAAKLRALSREALARDYPNIPEKRVRILLLDGGPEILKGVDPALQRAARGWLASEEVEVLTGVRAMEVTPDCVVLDDGREVPSENVIWTAGSHPNAKLGDLGLPLNKRGGDSGGRLPAG
jgi:NADH:ubiquinone reductase (H+-translocating)